MRVRLAADDPRQQAAERHRVLDAGVHALAAGRAVDVGGVAGQQDPAGAVVVGDAVVHAEPRAPQHLGDPRPGALPGPRASTMDWMSAMPGVSGASATVATTR